VKVVEAEGLDPATALERLRWGLGGD
jgi:hypothetical protein